MRAAKHLVLVVTTLIVAACATSGALRRGIAAEQRQDYDRAVVEYTNILRQHPDNTDARISLERAKTRAALDHFNKGRRFAALEKYEEALVEYELAAEMNPASSDIDTELRATRTQLKARIAVSREGKTNLETLIDRTRDLPPPGLELPPNVRMPGSLIFRDASSRDVYLAIARLANISIVFDSTFRESPVTVDLRNATLDTALESLSGASRTFFRVQSPGTVIVVPDNATKRREYEEEVVRTFYLSNADLKETQDLLRIVLDARRISPTTATNAITIKDTPERIAAAARVISAIDKARPEVIIDVELLEVDRTKLAEYGLQFASPTTAPTGINGTASVASPITLDRLRNLTQADVLLANLPTLYYRLLKSDTNTRTLANPQLRTSEGTPAQARFGERVPIPVVTFSPIAQGGVNQQPITSFNYETIGVNIDITPRTHHDDDVTLALRVVVQSISGTGFGGLPTFGNREINTVIRLRDGETNMLAGLIRDDERKVADGVPGLSDVPLVGRIFAHTRTESSQTDIILTLTPHIIRVLDLEESDLRAFRVGRDVTSPISEIALPIDLPRPPPPQQEPVNPGLPGVINPAPPSPQAPGTTPPPPPPQ